MGRLNAIYQNEQYDIVQVHSINAACDALDGALILYFQEESYFGAYLIAKSIEQYLHDYIKSKGDEGTQYRKFLATLNKKDRESQENLYKSIPNRLKHGSSGASETQLLKIPYAALEYILMSCTQALLKYNEKYLYYSPYFVLFELYYLVKFPNLSLPIDKKTKDRIESIMKSHPHFFTKNKKEFVNLFYDSAIRECEQYEFNNKSQNV